MSSKTRVLVIVVGMLALAVVGIAMHSDNRLIGADLIGAFAAVAVVLLASRGGAARFATRALGIVALLVIAVLSLTAHAAHWLTALTLAGAFVLAFTTWTSLGTREPPRDLEPPR